MLATLGRAPFDNHDDYVVEPKWDGFRVIAMMRGDSVQLFSRNLHPFTNLFRPITEALKDFPVPVVLDGEVVVFDKRGRPDFDALQGRLRPRKGRPTAILEAVAGEVRTPVFGLPLIHKRVRLLIQVRGEAGGGAFNVLEGRAGSMRWSPAPGGERHVRAGVDRHMPDVQVERPRLHPGGCRGGQERP